MGEARPRRIRDDADGAPLTLDEIVRAGLCIGCGLCVAIAPKASVAMVMTDEGRERPVARQPLGEESLIDINAVCPGTRVDGPDPEWASPSAVRDDVWGPVERVVIGHATDPDVRFKGSSGGTDLALEACARRNDLAENLAEARGARDRARSGRLTEPAPMEIAP